MSCLHLHAKATAPKPPAPQGGAVPLAAAPVQLLYVVDIDDVEPSQHIVLAQAVGRARPTGAGP
jgi:hypothetical protein